MNEDLDVIEKELICKAVLFYGQQMTMSQSSYPVGLLPQLAVILEKLNWDKKSF